MALCQGALAAPHPLNESQPTCTISRVMQPRACAHPSGASPLMVYSSCSRPGCSCAPAAACLPHTEPARPLLGGPRLPTSRPTTCCTACHMHAVLAWLAPRPHLRQRLQLFLEKQVVAAPAAVQQPHPGAVFWVQQHGLCRYKTAAHCSVHLRQMTSSRYTVLRGPSRLFCASQVCSN